MKRLLLAMLCVPCFSHPVAAAVFAPVAPVCDAKTTSHCTDGDPRSGSASDIRQGAAVASPDRPDGLTGTNYSTIVADTVNAGVGAAYNAAVKTYDAAASLVTDLTTPPPDPYAPGAGRGMDSLISDLSATPAVVPTPVASTASASDDAPAGDTGSSGSEAVAAAISNLADTIATPFRPASRAAAPVGGGRAPIIRANCPPGAKTCA